MQSSMLQTKVKAAGPEVRLQTCGLHRLAACLVVPLLLAGPPVAGAAEWTMGALGGVMVQPSSQYYHGVYGGYLDLASSKRAITLRLSYLERPPYHASGYTDTEQGTNLHLGTTLRVYGGLSLEAFLGYGQMSGSLVEEATHHRSSYAITGLSSLASVRLGLYGIAVTLSHQCVIGFDDPEQTSAFVAWPYSFFLVGMGAYL